MTVPPLIRALKGETLDRPPFWFMRQAGRYLPEYQEVRAQAGGFLDLCYTPDLAAEVTLQPLRRYGMDAAILFSDILVIPDALGQEVRFVQGEGPKLDPITAAADLDRLSLDGVADRLAPVLETVARVRAALTPDQALIGFAGAPFTVACYMVEGGGSKDHNAVRAMAWAEPAAMDRLMAMLVDATVAYLSAQIKAGAQAVQVFDSWAGVLPEPLFDRLVVAPTATIVDRLRADHPDIPIIGFPRGAGSLYAAYARQTGVDALGLDTAVPVEQAAALQKICCVQGNLDPALLLAGGPALLAEIDRLRQGLAGGPHVFNLGHGISQFTPPEHVAAAADRLRTPLAG